MMQFAVGDQVEHPSMGPGRVTAITPDGTVQVSYERWKSVGEYDDYWFQQHPGWLKRSDT